MSAPDRTVAVLGSFMMDLVVEAPRRPDPGETIFGSGFEIFLGGKGCNQAIAAARSGAITAMVGRLGGDDFGQRFLDCLAREGIDATSVVVDEVAGTGVGLPLVEPSGENSIVVVPRANHGLVAGDVLAARDVITGARVLLLQLELPVDTAVTAATLAREAGGTVVLNPAPAVADLDAFVGLVDVLVPNEGEAAVLSGVAGDPLGAGRALRAQLGCAVVVTVGEDGAWVIDDAGADRLPAHPVACLDTVGAGDAFCGALGARLAAGADLRSAVTYANAAAGLAVTQRGAEPAMPRAADIEALLAAGPAGLPLVATTD